MGVNQNEFGDIENFFNAYKARYIELNLLFRHMDNRRILIMHIGGVVIECLLKHRAIKELNITRCRKKYWYSEANINLLTSMHNASKNDIATHGEENPGHVLEDIAKLDSVLNSKLIPNSQFTNDLETVYNPLNKDKECFIDLRYINDDDIDDLDTVFKAWKEAFDRVYLVIKL